jgi:urease beta subunit
MHIAQYLQSADILEIFNQNCGSIKLISGEYVLSSNPVLCNENRRILEISNKNTGDRPCQMGSHTHFFEVIKALDFARQKTYGYRLNIQAGTSVRFEKAKKQGYKGA